MVESDYFVLKGVKDSFGGYRAQIYESDMFGETRELIMDDQSCRFGYKGSGTVNTAEQILTEDYNPIRFARDVLSDLTEGEYYVAVPQEPVAEDASLGPGDVVVDRLEPADGCSNEENTR